MTKQNIHIPFFFIVIVGIASLISQVSFIRLNGQSFHGNEISMCFVLGHWLLWTGLGSYFSSKIVLGNFKRKYLFILSLTYCLALLIFSNLLLIIRPVLNINISEIQPLEKTFLITLILFSIPGFLNGMFFPFLVKWINIHTKQSAMHFVYITEIIGSILAALIFYLLILLKISTLSILQITILILVLTSIILFINSARKKFLSFLISIIIFIIINQLLTPLLIKIKWQPFTTISQTESPYLAISKVNNYSEETIFGNNEPLWTFGNKKPAEEMVHFALLNHPNPKSVVIIGLATEDIFVEIDKYTCITNVVVIQTDEILQNALLNNNKNMGKYRFEILFINKDPFVYLNSINSKHDIILLNIPMPVNLLWNRFYSQEFLKLYNNILHFDGILAIHLEGNEVFLTGEQIKYLKILENTTLSTFNYSTWIPGNTIHLLASDSQFDNLSLLNKMKEIGLENDYITDYYLIDRLAPMKKMFLENRLKKCDETAINSIIKPFGFYYYTLFWNEMTGTVFKPFYNFLSEQNLLVIIIVILFLFFLLFSSNHNETRQLFLNMLICGFSIMSIQTILIILYQSYIGGLYQQIMLLTSIFMVGAGLGSIIHLKFINKNSYKSLYLFLLFLIFLSVTSLILTKISNIKIFYLIIYFLILGNGILSSLIFSQISTLYKIISKKNIAHLSGKIYALDIIGSGIGVYLTSAMIIPIWGMISAIQFIFIINLVVFTWNLLNK